jgi:hypothetical protein
MVVTTEAASKLEPPAWTTSPAPPLSEPSEEEDACCDSLLWLELNDDPLLFFLSSSIIWARLFGLDGLFGLPASDFLLPTFSAVFITGCFLNDEFLGDFETSDSDFRALFAGADKDLMAGPLGLSTAGLLLNNDLGPRTEGAAVSLELTDLGCTGAGFWVKMLLGGLFDSSFGFECDNDLKGSFSFTREPRLMVAGGCSSVPSTFFALIGLRLRADIGDICPFLMNENALVERPFGELGTSGGVRGDWIDLGDITPDIMGEPLLLIVLMFKSTFFEGGIAGGGGGDELSNEWLISGELGDGGDSLLIIWTICYLNITQRDQIE